MKKLIAALLVSALCACGGGGGGGVADTGDQTLTRGNETVRLDQDAKYNLTVPSSNNTITIGADNTLGTVGMAGTNNTLNVESGTVIDSLEVIGANNSVSLGNTVTIANLDIQGGNATLTITAGGEIGLLTVSGSNAAITIASATADVPDIRLRGSNIQLLVPAGYLPQTTITDTGTNNTVAEQ